MPRRRQARETALQALYQRDLNPSADRDMLTEFLDQQLGPGPLLVFATELVDGVTSMQDDLDARIARAAENWTIDRMAATDRNIIRMAAYELLHADVPYRVALDEAIELAKHFGDANSPAFVNGVLDALIPEEQREQTGVADAQKPAE